MSGVANSIQNYARDSRQGNWTRKRNNKYLK